MGKIIEESWSVVVGCVHPSSEGALVGVEKLRPAAVCNGLFERLGAKVRGHGVRQPPIQDFARGPVHYRHQVGKALGHWDVR